MRSGRGGSRIGRQRVVRARLQLRLHAAAAASAAASGLVAAFVVVSSVVSSSSVADGFVPAAGFDEACCVDASGTPAFDASRRVATLCFSVCANGTAVVAVAASVPAALDEPAPRAALSAVPAVSSSAPSRGRGGMSVLSFECGGRLRRTGRVGPHAQDLRGVFVGVALFAPGVALRFQRDAARLQDFERADGAFLVLPVRAGFVDTDFGRGQHAALLRDRGVERIDERLEIAPVAGRHPVLRGLREACVVFIAVAQQRVELLGGRGAVALRGAELLRRGVEIFLRAVEQQLKGKAVCHRDQPP